NTDPFQESIIYDPTAPQLDTGSSPTVTAPLTTTSIVVSLAFQNIHVKDDLYGDGAGPGTNDFWGVWVANSTTDVEPAADSGKWLPMEISTPRPSFTIDWSLFGGITNPTGDQDYYIFVKFLDGAGNPTSETIQVRKIHLEANFTKPTLYLPEIHK